MRLQFTIDLNLGSKVGKNQIQSIDWKCVQFHEQEFINIHKLVL